MRCNLQCLNLIIKRQIRGGGAFFREKYHPKKMHWPNVRDSKAEIVKQIRKFCILLSFWHEKWCFRWKIPVILRKMAVLTQFFFGIFLILNPTFATILWEVQIFKNWIMQKLMFSVKKGYFSQNDRFGSMFFWGYFWIEIVHSHYWLVFE